MRKDFKDFLSEIGILHRAISGQAHGQHGTAEGHIKTMRRTMAKLTAEFPELRPATILSLAVMGHNGGESVRGSSSFFWSGSKGYIDENATLTYNRMQSQVQEDWPESGPDLDGASVTAASHTDALFDGPDEFANRHFMGLDDFIWCSTSSSRRCEQRASTRRSSSRRSRNWFAAV